MKLSIVTVNFNNLEGLRKTYESIVCQTFTDYEWLVIDGGSTDGSREFIEQHQNKFAYWCSEKDKGIYNAMNKGLIRTKGEYINFMNSGDCFVSKETLAAVFCKERKADILYGYEMIGSINGTFYPPLSMQDKVRWYALYRDSLPHQASFIRRCLFNTIGLYDENCKIVADWKWFAKAFLSHEASYEFIPRKIAIMQKGGISDTVACLSERKRQREEIFPHYITEEDALNLTILSIIQSKIITCFLFKILKVISIYFNSIHRRYIIV